MDKINCGGFYLGEGLELDGNVLNATGSGGGMLVVNATRDEGGQLSVDKTFEQIKSSFPNVILVENIAGMGTSVYHLVSSADTSEAKFISFCQTIVTGTNVTTLSVSVGGDNSVMEMSTSYPSNNEPL